MGVESFLHIFRKVPAQDEMILNAFIGKVERRELEEFAIGSKPMLIDLYGKTRARIRILWGEPHEGHHLEKSYFVKSVHGQLEVTNEGFFNTDNHDL